MKIAAVALATALALPTLAEAGPMCERFGTCGSAPHFSSSFDVGKRDMRPAGCPRRYCGCAMSLRKFGKIIPRLNLAANWLAFPRVRARPGAVAARRGHVMELLSHVRGDRWRVYDPNSGRGLTRIHVRSVRGFAFVDPHARQFAGLP